jgi:toxin ParE1/3/4
MLYHLSENAARDLDEIFDYWSSRVSPEIADRIIDNITERFWLLGEHPAAGKSVTHIARGLKCFPAGKYLIYYRSTRRGTDILHIFHGARQQRRAFKPFQHSKKARP